MVKGPSISLCMIAKNEEQWIKQCIQSVKNLVDDIVLVDTGSSDRTVQVAKSFGARVYDRPWDDDFSAPRNLSIKKARGDWILVLDADEALDTKDFDKIKMLIQNRKLCYLLTQRHYTDDARLSGFRPVKGEHPVWERTFGGYFESSCVRLFPNHDGIEYRNRIHELVEPCIEELKHHTVVHSGIRIHHYGHTRGVRQVKSKGPLYTALGEQKLKDQPVHWKGFFELAVEHQVNGRYPQSIEAFLKSIELHPTYLDSWINLGYVLGESGLYKDAASALQTAINLNPKSHEAFCNLGVVHLRTQNHPAALNCFGQAITLNREYVNAWCNLGETYIQMGLFERAAVTFQEALKLFPNCAKAKEGMGTSLLFLGQAPQAECILRHSLEQDPSLSRPYYWLSQIYRLNDKIQEAVDCLEQFCKLEASQPRPPDPSLIRTIQEECRSLRKFL
jgi:tetratricopeptide (TPR) repeat protein